VETSVADARIEGKPELTGAFIPQTKTPRQGRGVCRSHAL